MKPQRIPPEDSKLTIVKVDDTEAKPENSIPESCWLPERQKIIRSLKAHNRAHNRKKW